jgi:hypothetical protein
VAIAPPLFTKVVVVELKRVLVEKKMGKEGLGGQPATHFGRLAPHLVVLMHKPLTKSIKSKAISLHSFPKFLLFIWIFLFFDMQWLETKRCYGKGVNKNMVDERERDKN